MVPENVHKKYEGAVSLYATTDLSSKRIAEACNVSVGGLRAYLRRHFRHLILVRHGYSAEAEAPSLIHPRKGQTLRAHLKYKEAIAACDDRRYLDCNITQIAAMFGLDGCGLSNQLRLHYPEILQRREAARRSLGLSDGYRRGVKEESVAQYAEALALCRTTDWNLARIAEVCHVSLGGLSQYLRFYHKELGARREAAREGAKGSHRRGALSGNGRVCRPDDETVRKYASALALYRTTLLTVREIAARSGVTTEGFAFYLRMWHRDLMQARRGYRAAAKYAPAIASLKEMPRPMAQVAAEFGLAAEPFRVYLHAHEPALVAALGRKKEKNNETITNKD